MTVTDPEPHAHRTLADRFADSFNLTDAVQIFDSVWRRTGLHIDNTVDGLGGFAFSAIKGKVPPLAAAVAVVDAKHAIPEHAQSSII